MNEEPTKPAKLSLKDFYVSKKQLELPSGTLYVSHISVRALQNFLDQDLDKIDPRALGLSLLRHLVFEAADGPEAVTQERFDALHDEELKSLAASALPKKTNQIGEEDPIRALGVELRSQVSAFRESRESITRSMGSLGFLDSSTIDSLRSSVLGIDSATQALRSASALNGLGDTIRNLQSLRDQSVLGYPGLSGELKASERHWKESYTERPLPNIDFSNTPAVRAAKASETTAERLQEVTEALALMGGQIGRLTTTLVGEAIPQWMSKQDEDKVAAKLSLDRAAHSLKWTKWAVMASVVTSLSIAVAQYILSRNDGHVEAAQAASYELLLKQQISETRLLREHLQLELDERARLNEKQKVSPTESGVDKRSQSQQETTAGG